MGRDVLLDVNVVLQGPVHWRIGVQHRSQLRTQYVSRVGARHAGACQLRAAAMRRSEPTAGSARSPALRPGASSADDVHLGNFVEIKNSAVGAGSKVNHLSYVGDSEVGSGVNVGAGTITCNYDGANKWRTRIGDGAFIGSGSMLVAPVDGGRQRHHRRRLDHHQRCAGATS